MNEQYYKHLARLEMRAIILATTVDCHFEASNDNNKDKKSKAE